MTFKSGVIYGSQNWEMSDLENLVLLCLERDFGKFLFLINYFI